MKHYKALSAALLAILVAVVAYQFFLRTPETATAKVVSGHPDLPSAPTSSAFDTEPSTNVAQPSTPASTTSAAEVENTPAPRFVENPNAVDTFDLALFDTAEGELFELKLPGDRSYQVKALSIRENPSGSQTWIGQLEGLSPIYQLILTYTEDFVTGRILTPDGLFHVRTQNGQFEIVDVKEAGYEAPERKEDFRIPAPKPAQPAARMSSPSGIYQQAASPATTAAATDTSTLEPLNASDPFAITLMVIYDREMLDIHGTEANVVRRIEQLLSNAYYAYYQSKVDITLRIVHSAGIDYDAFGDNDLALDQLTQSTGAFAEVASLRNEYAADLVTFIRPFRVEQGSCGVAWLFTGPSPEADQYGFSVVSDGADSVSGYYCDEYTLVHELGHNFGSVHDRANAAGPGAYPYSYGYGVNGSFGTIMSYIEPVIGFFSDPALDCGVSACGVGENSPNAANNALSHNNTYQHIAAYRTNEALLTLNIDGPGTVSVRRGSYSPYTKSVYDCVDTCSLLVEIGATVDLWASPDRNKIVVGWTGEACAAANDAMRYWECDFVLTGETTVGMQFSDYPMTQLNLDLQGPGNLGVIYTHPVSRDRIEESCLTACSLAIPEGVEVDLIAVAETDKEFWDWSGDGCTEYNDLPLGRNFCKNLIMDAEKSISASFGAPRGKIDVTLAGQINAGQVLSTPSGLNCGDTCSAKFILRDILTLEATPTPGHVFWKWEWTAIDYQFEASSFDCYLKTTCQLTPTGDLAVAATFLADLDGDLIGDDYEVLYGLNPSDSMDAVLDTDGDGLDNLAEFRLDIDPTNSDSDGDGLPDFWEVSHSLLPGDYSDAAKDKDQDGVSNYQEYLAGTDPTSPTSVAVGSNIFLVAQVVGDPWQTYRHDLQFTKPFVMTGVPSSSDGAPIMHAAGAPHRYSVDHSLQRLNPEQPEHGEERSSLILAEQMRWTMPDGSIWETGTLSSTYILHRAWPRRSFSTEFPGRPFLFLRAHNVVNSFMGDWAIGVKAFNVESDGFDFLLNLDEKNGLYPVANISYLAIYHPDGAPTEGHISSGSLTFGSGITQYHLTRISLSNQPQDVLRDSIWLQEDTSLDEETTHAFEQVDVLSLNGKLFAQVVSNIESDPVSIRRRGRAPLDVDQDGDADANDGVMIQRRLTGAGTVTNGIILPESISGNADVVSAIDEVLFELDVDGDGDSDANDGVMIQRRLTGAGTVTTNIMLPAVSGGNAVDGARSNQQVTDHIDGIKPLN